MAQPIAMPQFEGIDEIAEQGATEYGARCMACHGFDAISPGMAADLRASAILASSEAFAGVVRGGSRQMNAMPVFEHLTDSQLTAIWHYVRHQADVALKATQGTE